MRLAKCNGERCNATFPLTARFCPRCGRAVDSFSPAAKRRAARPAWPRRRVRFPILRAILVCWFLVFAIRHLSYPRPAAIPATVSPVPPVSVEVAPDFSSIERFIAWRGGFVGDRKKIKRLVEGQEVRWAGTLKKSLVPGRYDLVDESGGKESVRLVPVTADAKDDIHRIASGTHVQIEGVLMDERSVHVVSVREVPQI